MIPVVLFAPAFLVRAAVGALFVGPAYPDLVLLRPHRRAAGLRPRLRYRLHLELRRRPTLALPDEPVEVLLDLARNFEAQAVVLVEGRGRYPHDLATAQDSCFKPLASAITGGATVYLIDRECVR